MIEYNINVVASNLDIDEILVPEYFSYCIQVRKNHTIGYRYESSLTDPSLAEPSTTEPSSTEPIVRQNQVRKIFITIPVRYKYQTSLIQFLALICIIL